MDNKEKFLTLKEASEISGYAPDYIGQLIRIGKLTGKQIYCNVAWVTTEDAIRKYMEEEQCKSKGFLTRKLYQAQAELAHPTKHLSKTLKLVLYPSIITLILFIVFLFYIFSVNLEKKLQQKLLNKVNIERNEQNGEISQQDSHLLVTY